MDKKNKEFFLSSWAINNKTIIYVLMIIFLISGITAYKTMPRELFPEINSSNIFVILPLSAPASISPPSPKMPIPQTSYCS